MDTFVIVLIVFLLLIILLNQKINILFVFKEFFNTFYNYGEKKKKKTSNKKIIIFDMLSIVFVPIAIACIFTLYYKFEVDKNLAQVLITTFSLISTMQFSFLAIIVSQNNESNNTLKAIIIKETYIALTLSIFLAVVNVIILLFFTNALYLFNIQVSSIIVLSISFICFIIIFIILKRMYALLNGNFQDNK